ncbi:MAG: hypothetical protein CME06_06420 [Gemmatimonadetes bacterium]|nr:hypothetical protein [Gemmatimonadota bacterium]
MRPRPIIALVALAVVFLGAVSLRGSGSGADGRTPTAEVEHGPFVVGISESGEIEATSSMTISSPRVGDWGSRPQITWLAEEGTQVAKGDVIARFDPSGLEKHMFQTEAELQIKEASLTRSKASQAATTAELEASVLNSEASFELAKLALDQLQFEPEVKRREGELRFAQAENDLAQARAKVSSQRIIDTEELRRVELEKEQASAELEKARQDRAALDVRAPADGLIVYERNWNTGNKFQVGDTPWPGQAIIGLPDLSEVRVKTQVNEVDISKLEVGQAVRIRLDAFEGPVFPGTVSDVATLGRRKEDGSEVKVFDVNVLIDTTAAILKPGMTASCEIIVREIEDTLTIPIDAVFREGERMTVYRADGSKWRAVPVELGARNEDRVVVASGVGASDVVALIDPNAAEDLKSAKLDELSKEGADSTPRQSTRRRRGRRGR